jgi:hypothetical protein
MTIASFAEVNESAPGTAVHQRPCTWGRRKFCRTGRTNSQIMADQATPIGELRKDFDRLRTVLFKRLRTQSSNFNYKGKRKLIAGADENRGGNRIYAHRRRREVSKHTVDSVGKRKVASIQATSAGPYPYCGDGTCSTSRLSTPARPINTSEAQAGHCRAQLPMQLQSWHR